MAYVEQKNQGGLSRQGSIATLEEQLELNISVRNIPKKDLLSSSDNINFRIITYPIFMFKFPMSNTVVVFCINFGTVWVQTFKSLICQ